MQHAGSLVAALRASQQTAPFSDRLEWGDDLGEHDFPGWGGELKPALGTSLRPQDAGPHERVQRLGEVVSRTAKHGGNLVDPHGAAIGVGGDAQDGVNRLLSGTG